MKNTCNLYKKKKNIDMTSNNVKKSRDIKMRPQLVR